MKFLPDDVYKTIFEIDFVKLYAKGKRIILSDLDNTLATYQEHGPSVDLIAWSKRVRSLGFKLYLISNNKEERINKFLDDLDVTGFVASAHKPLSYKLKRFIKQEAINPSEVVFIGDQLVTDVIIAKKCNLYVILVETLDRSTEKWYTRINRLREKKMIKRIKQNNPEIYQKMVEIGMKYE